AIPSSRSSSPRTSTSTAPAWTRANASAGEISRISIPPLSRDWLMWERRKPRRFFLLSRRGVGGSWRARDQKRPSSAPSGHLLPAGGEKGVVAANQARSHQNWSVAGGGGVDCRGHGCRRRVSAQGRAARGRPHPRLPRTPGRPHTAPESQGNASRLAPLPQVGSDQVRSGRYLRLTWLRRRFLRATWRSVRTFLRSLYGFSPSLNTNRTGVPTSLKRLRKKFSR